MKCEEFKNRFIEYLDGESDDAQEFEEHMKSCPDCGAEYSSLASFDGALRESMEGDNKIYTEKAAYMDELIKKGVKGVEFRETIALNDRLNTLSDKADKYEKEDNFDKAIECTDKILKILPDREWYINSRKALIGIKEANKIEKEGRLEEALFLLDALEVKIDSPKITLYRWQLVQKKINTLLVLDQARKWLKNKEYLLTMFACQDIYNMGVLDNTDAETMMEAVEILGGVFEEYPNMSSHDKKAIEEFEIDEQHNALNMMGQIYDLSENYDKAIKYYTLWHTIDSQSYIIDRIIEVLIKNTDFDEAEKLLLENHFSNQDKWESDQEREDIKDEKLQSILDDLYKEASVLEAKYPCTAFETIYVQILLGKNDFKKAINYQKKICVKSVNRSSFGRSEEYSKLASIYVKLGDLDHAKFFFEMALASEDDNLKAKDGIRIIEKFVADYEGKIESNIQQLKDKVIPLHSHDKYSVKLSNTADLPENIKKMFAFKLK